MKTLEEKTSRKTEVSVPMETLEERLKRIEHKIEMIWLEVFQASSTNIDTAEHKRHLKGRVDEIEEKLKSHEHRNVAPHGHYPSEVNMAGSGMKHF